MLTIYKVMNKICVPSPDAGCGRGHFLFSSEELAADCSRFERGRRTMTTRGVRHSVRSGLRSAGLIFAQVASSPTPPGKSGALGRLLPPSSERVARAQLHSSGFPPKAVSLSSIPPRRRAREKRNVLSPNALEGQNISRRGGGHVSLILYPPRPP